MNTEQKNKQELDTGRMQKFRLGDKNAFKDLFFDFYPKLLRFVKRYVKSEETADDIVKVMFIELWEKRQHLAIHTSVNAYLYSAARNRSLNYLRSQNTFIEKYMISNIEEEEFELIESSANIPYEVLEEKELTETVNKVIESLPGKCKLIFTMHKYDGLKYSEIAQILEISVKTVENQMMRAFKILRQKLAHFLPAAIIALVEFIYHFT